MSIKKIGIAGYMGAGKSSCVKMLQRDSTVTLTADSIAKELMLSDGSIKQKLAQTFGANICNGTSINFAKLGTVVFESPQKLQLLNAIVHPPLLDTLNDALFGAKDPRFTEIILDAALIPFWKIESWFDYLIWVDAAPAIRLERLVHRSHGTIAVSEIEKRIFEQEKLFVRSKEFLWINIENNSTLSALKVQCDNVLHKMLP